MDEGPHHERSQEANSHQPKRSQEYRKDPNDIREGEVNMIFADSF